MAHVETLSIALSSDMASTVKAAVDSGEYATPSDVIGDALRDWTGRRAAESPTPDNLRRSVQAGVDSGRDMDAEPVFARLRAKYVGMS